MSKPIEVSADRWTAWQYSNPQELASGVAERFLSAVEGGAGRRSVALSGGRITEVVYRELVSKSESRNVAWEELDFFWADERCVPLEDAASNFRLAQDLLFGPLGVKDSQKFPFAGGKEPALMSQEGQAMIRQYFGGGDSEVPVFDFAFLGMGEDGHIASLFPENRDSDLNRTEPCYDVIASKPPPNRITLSYPVFPQNRRFG